MNRYLNRTNVILLTITAFCFVFASCTAAEIVAVTTAVGAGAGIMLDAAAPFMSTEQFAEFRNGVEQIDGSVEATKSVLTVIGDAFASFRDAVQARELAQAATINEQAHTIAAMPARAEVAAWGIGGGSGGTALSRMLSMLKHGTPGTPAKPPAA